MRRSEGRRRSAWRKSVSEEERLLSAAELAKVRADASDVEDVFARFAGGGAAIGRADEG